MRKPYLLKSDKASLSFEDVTSVSYKDINNVNHQDVSYWLIDMRIWADGWDNLCQIRRNLSPDIYLKPVVFVIDPDTMPHEFTTAADGNIEYNSCDKSILEGFASRVEPINQWIDDLPNAHSSSDTNIAFKVLRMIASRNVELEPIKTIQRNSGFVYPLLEPLFGKRDTGVFETLSFLESQHLVNPHFITRAHFCSHCGSAFLNFKETCSLCHLDDIRSDELVHHFKCAYTAEMGDFRQGEKLVCPKCEQQLKHIGVDYDKPSIIYHCNQCSHTFQDPKIMTSCYNCGRDGDPEHQELRTIQSYSVSAIGQNAANFGLDALFTNILNTELNLFTEQSFRDFLKIEMSRIQRYKLSNSTIALIHFHDLDTLYIQLGQQAREVFAELSVVFKTVLRTSDAITAKNETVFIIIMTETNLEHAERALERLKDGVQELFKNNLEFTPNISTSRKVIDAKFNLNLMLEEFLQNVD